MGRQRGFTIVELMIVVTIIGTLSAIAIPFYQRYVTRAMVAEALQLARPAQLAVTDRYAQSGQWPADNASANLAAPAALGGRYVRSVAVTGGTVVVTFGETAVLGHTVTFTPSASGAAVSWACRSTLPDPLRPPDCH